MTEAQAAETAILMGTALCFAVLALIWDYLN